MIDYTLFKPKKSGINDKYSWNIYRYLRDRVKERYDLRIKFYTKSRFDGQKVNFDHSSLNSAQVYIMTSDENRSGTTALELMRKGSRAELETYSFCLFNPNDFIDITDWFLKNYQQYGRCLFDLKHCGWWADAEERYTKINKNSMRCNWCGQYLIRKIKTIKTIKREKVWEVKTS